MTRRWTLLVLAALPLLTALAGAEDDCAAYGWSVQSVTDSRGNPDPYRFAILYRVRPDGVRPTRVVQGLGICPGDILETWHGATTTLIRGNNVGSIVAEGGAVLHFSDRIVQKSGTVTYLMPSGWQESVEATLKEGALLVASLFSTVQISMTGPTCDPIVEVSVSALDDPYIGSRTTPNPKAHRAQLTRLDAEGKPRGPLLVVEGDQSARLTPDGELPKQAAPLSAAAREVFKRAEPILRAPLTQRGLPTEAEREAFAATERRLIVLADAQPTALSVNGLPWAPWGWFRGGRGESRRWEATRLLRLPPGESLVEVTLPDGRRAGVMVFGSGDVVVDLRAREEAPPRPPPRDAPPTLPEFDPTLPEAGLGAEEAARAALDPAVFTEAITELEPANELPLGPEGGVAEPVPIMGPCGIEIKGGPTGETYKPKVPGLDMTFVGLSAGQYCMGSPERVGHSDERPQHPVKLSAFMMGKSEVTQAQWRAVVKAGQAAKYWEAMSLELSPSHYQGDHRPVSNVSWCEAVRFANALSRLEGRTAAYKITGRCIVRWVEGTNGYRLPTEAEWEYAARAGTTTAYVTGDDEADLARAGWYGNLAGTGTGNSRGSTHDVCTAQDKPWGLCDLYGNIEEWAWDRYWPRAYELEAVSDPRGGRGTAQVIRGGNYFSRPNFARSASRDYKRRPYRASFVGFRLVLPPQQPPAN